jgi:DNA-nicking Smr family endonuclease
MGAAVPAPPKPTPPPKPGAIETKVRRQLSRGARDVDARLDLHGLTQALAHQRLRHFLEDVQTAGGRLVLVITGKGKPGDAGVDERGVLKRSVPDWLESNAFRHLVAGYDEAGRRHGGAGALYVRLRRKRRA